MRTALTILVCVLTTSAGTGHALPPGEAGRGFVEGANHHLGDASFVARHGRPPTARDPEPLRMHTHLVYVRALLGSGRATRPELEPQRARLLSYLDDYIAAGLTPKNHVVPWRSPVFVDVFCHVCAVGYLIERSAGRALVDRIADLHLTDFLEDIAAAMPAVAAWVAGSGLSLEELASIQPGYEMPPIEQWEQWELSHRRPNDGPWLVTADGFTTRGAWVDGQMHGLWTREDNNGRVVGRGEFTRGRGTWTSFDGSGRTLAAGPFRRSYPEGTWRFFHVNGRLAARGPMARGRRFGAWTFYYDSEGEVPIARGGFARGGRVTGKWRHFDAKGRVFATTSRGPDADYGEALMMHAKPAGGLTHTLVEGTFAADFERVDGFAFEGARYFRHNFSGEPQLYAADGRGLTRDDDGAWVATGCPWGASSQASARRGDLLTLRGRLHKAHSYPAQPETCLSPGAVPVARSEADRLDRLTTALEVVRVPTPGFVNDYFRDPSGEDSDDSAEAARDPVPVIDLGLVVAANMTWYVEWPHIDGPFANVFKTLPGHFPPGVAGSTPEAHETPSDEDGRSATLVVSMTAAADGGRPVVAFR